MLLIAEIGKAQEVGCWGLLTITKFRLLKQEWMNSNFKATSLPKLKAVFIGFSYRIFNP